MNSITPTYRFEMKATGGSYTPAGWNVKRDGRPTDAALAAYVESFEASTRPDGVNGHLGEVVVFSARIVRQTTGDVVASYSGPLFSVAA